jgi:hypothetical protein
MKQNENENENINSNLMFCVPEKHKFNNKLNLKNINPINKMCIF